METLTTYLTSFLSLCLLSVIIKVFNKLWWMPIRIQSLMKSQGINGPSYSFLYGNTKDIIKMRNRMLSTPSELSHQLFLRLQPHIYAWTKLYGMNFLIWYGPQAQLVVTEPELVKEVLNNKDGAYRKADPVYEVKKLLGDGLVLSGGEKWLKMRKLVNHALHGESLRSMIPEMIASVEVMLEKWKQHEGREIEVFQELRILTSEVMSRTAFGSSYLEGQDIFEMLTKMGFIIAKNTSKIRIPLIDKFVRARDAFEMEKLEQGIRNSIIKMMKKREEEMLGEQDSYGNDFLGCLLKAYHEADKSKRISLDDLIDECKIFYIAGQETTSSALTWIILLLAIYTDWQDNVRKEVLEVFGQQNPSPDGIAKLQTMSMVINESLRLYPPAANLLRKVEREVKMGKAIVPANVEVFIPVLALHHSPKIWGEDAHLFKPERFADGVAKATNYNLGAHVPFGLGPRICAGVNFALTETKIALSMILQHYRFTLSPSYVHSPVQILTVCPQHGVQIILQPL